MIRLVGAISSVGHIKHILLTPLKLVSYGAVFNSRQVCDKSVEKSPKGRTTVAHIRGAREQSESWVVNFEHVSSSRLYSRQMITSLLLDSCKSISGGSRIWKGGGAPGFSGLPQNFLGKFQPI